MKTLFAILLSACTCLTSCTDFVSNTKPVVSNPSADDLGIIGDWNLPKSDEQSTQEWIHISLAAHSKSTYEITLHSGKTTSQFTLKCEPLKQDSEFLLLQLNAKNSDSYFFGYATVQKDAMRFWMVSAEKLTAELKDRNINSVIDRGFFSTETTVDSADLKKLLLENPRKLAPTHGDATRITKNGK